MLYFRLISSIFMLDEYLYICCSYGNGKCGKSRRRMTSEWQINGLSGLLAVKMIRQQISPTDLLAHHSTTLLISGGNDEFELNIADLRDRSVKKQHFLMQISHPYIAWNNVKIHENRASSFWAMRQSMCVSVVLPKWGIPLRGRGPVKNHRRGIGV